MSGPEVAAVDTAAAPGYGDFVPVAVPALAKQYTITLPADYEMEIVRRRVADRGRAFDTWPGLGFKAFLISESARGASANRYAPFYLWNELEGTNEFLYGDGFAALSGAFGRPLIEHWIPLGARRPLPAAAPLMARRSDRLVTAREPMPDVAARERGWLERQAESSGFAGGVVALDPYRWQLVRFTLWSGPAPEPDADAVHYEVLHLAVPGAAA